MCPVTVVCRLSISWWDCMFLWPQGMEILFLQYITLCTVIGLVESSWNMMAHGDAREGKCRGNWRMEWAASTLHTTSAHGVSSITTVRVQLKCVGTRWRREEKWRGNWRMEYVASTLHTTSEHGVSSITTTGAHTSAASSRLKWRPRRFKWTRPFRRKTKSGFCACAITFQTQSTNVYG
jgi:hypothetical protein